MKAKFDQTKLALLTEIRRTLDAHFAADTAYPGTQSSVASAGHCAIVSAIASLTVGGGVASTTVGGVSHWINRVSDGTRLWDIDLTGDQFGLPVVQIAEAGKLYPGVKPESLNALNEETLQRALKLAGRAGMRDAVPPLTALLKAKLGESAVLAHS